jgi:hypothetical protein
MVEACYMARTKTKQQDLNSIKKLTFQTNEHGQYTHNAIPLLQKGIRCPPELPLVPSSTAEEPSNQVFVKTYPSGSCSLMTPAASQTRHAQETNMS